MFQHGPSAFDPRLNAIAEQLRAIEKQLGGISKTASDRAAATASSPGTQFTEARRRGPVLSRSQRSIGSNTSTNNHFRNSFFGKPL